MEQVHAFQIRGAGRAWSSFKNFPRTSRGGLDVVALMLRSCRGLASSCARRAAAPSRGSARAGLRQRVSHHALAPSVRVALPALSTTAHLAVPALRLRALRIALDFDGEEEDDDR